MLNFLTIQQNQILVKMIESKICKKNAPENNFNNKKHDYTYVMLYSGETHQLL